jgi:hypothetical protein
VINAYKILVGKHQRKRALGRPRYRLENNMKLNNNEIEYDGVVWIYLI